MSKDIRIAFEQNYGIFEIDEKNGYTMREFPVWKSFLIGAQDNEFLSSFFATHNLTPTWTKARLGVFGGTWSAVVIVSRTEFVLPNTRPS